MSERITLQIELELLSDAVFGNGQSVPGAEDISVCRDSAGYPYIKGTVFKGLLRESCENLICWEGLPESLSDELFGRDGWAGTAGDRRLQLTSLTLKDYPQDPESCFSFRAFTQMKNGVAKDGSLRMARVMSRGLVFGGSITCSAENEGLLKSALAGIRYGGTMRSRGFGQLCFRVTDTKAETMEAQGAPAACLEYQLTAELPLQFTQLSASGHNSYETRTYVPGTAVRGLALSYLAAQDPDWFKANVADLLTQIVFRNGLLAQGEEEPLPSIKGFYEPKDESALENVVVNKGKLTPGYKRAKLGVVCALEGSTIHYGSTATGESMRIDRKKAASSNGGVFQTRHIEAGQSFKGYILLDKPELAPRLIQALQGVRWIGADRYEGFGKCSISVKPVACQGWESAYGESNPGTELYLLAMTPLAMTDATGELCGINCEALASHLGVSSVAVDVCSTSVSEYGSYNRTWGCRDRAARMYDAGSLFKLICSEPPSADKLSEIQRRGLGIRKTEGYGSVLFLRKELLEGITDKQSASTSKVSEDRAALAAERRARLTWIMNNAHRLKNTVSASQLGNFQAVCKTAAGAGKRDAIDAFLNKNLTERGAKHAAPFKKLQALADEILGVPVSVTIGCNAHDTLRTRCLLLSDLIDFSRKSNKDNQ